MKEQLVAADTKTFRQQSFDGRKTMDIKKESGSILNHHPRDKKNDLINVLFKIIDIQYNEMTEDISDGYSDHKKEESYCYSHSVFKKCVVVGYDTHTHIVIINQM